MLRAKNIQRYVQLVLQAGVMNLFF
jgi:hypothetical protein